MEDFLTSCVDRYLELAGPGTKMITVATPFLADDQNTSLVRKQSENRNTRAPALNALGASIHFKTPTVKPVRTQSVLLQH
eukprot:7952323-Heterocapsa_arctica.AAC.1